MKAESPPRISEAEWNVMRVIWGRHPVTAAEIIAELQETDRSCHPKTVRTLLARLVRKGALNFVHEGRLYRYAPAFTEQDCIAAASDSFLERVFGGALTPLLVHFLRDRQLSSAELARLRRLIDEAAGDQAEKES